ncbi:MAG: tetratricopeptide repeat protein [Promethearchaeota archaeon]
MEDELHSLEEQLELERAQSILDDVVKLCQKNNLKGATYLTMRVIEIYLNAGLYLHISPAFNQLIVFVQKETDILLIMEKVQNVIVELEYLNLEEEIAKLKLVLAVLAYKQENFVEAANLYQEVAEKFLAVDPDDYRQACVMFLFRAAECFERINRLKRAKQLIYEAIKQNDSSIFDYPAHCESLKELIYRKKYEESITELREIAGFFRNIRQNLREMNEFSDTLEYLKKAILARLLHMISEFNLLKIMCYRFLNNSEAVRAQAEKSIKDLQESVKIFKALLKQSRYSSADLRQVTFTVFLLQIFQEFANYQIEDPKDLLLRDVPPEIQDKLKKYPFFQYTMHIVEFDLKHSLEFFDEIILSHILEPFRAFIMQSLKILD